MQVLQLSIRKRRLSSSRSAKLRSSSRRSRSHNRSLDDRRSLGNLRLSSSHNRSLYNRRRESIANSA
jgi:hypothetical protein